MLNPNRVVVGFCTLALAFMMGCGGDDFGRTMVPVKGKVTIKGEPVKADKNLYVVFEKEGERPESLPVNPDGTFAGEVPRGECTVGLQVYGAIDGIKEEHTTGTGVLKANTESTKEFTFEVGE